MMDSRTRKDSVHRLSHRTCYSYIKILPIEIDIGEARELAAIPARYEDLKKRIQNFIRSLVFLLLFSSFPDTRRHIMIQDLMDKQKLEYLRV